jgi:hypothetical protein
MRFVYYLYSGQEEGAELVLMVKLDILILTAITTGEKEDK